MLDGQPWVNDILKLLFGAINKITSSLLPIFLANLVSIGLELAHGALGIVISVLTAPVVAAIKTGISLLALAFKAVSILRPWSLRLTSSPQPISYSNRPGSVRLSVADPGPIAWPEILQNARRTSPAMNCRSSRAPRTPRSPGPSTGPRTPASKGRSWRSTATARRSRSPAGGAPAADPDLLAKLPSPALRYDWAGRICGSTLTAAEAAEYDH